MSNLSKILAQGDCNYTKLNEDTIKNVSKNIASILYTSLAAKNPTDVNERLNVLGLLQKWCINQPSHLNVNESNYDCFLKTVPPQRSLDFDYDNEENVTDTSSSVLEYLNKLADFNTKIAHRQNLIFKYDFNKSSPEFNRATTRQTALVLNSIEAVRLIIDQSSCSAVTRKQTSFVATALHRQIRNQISVGYALLNLDHAGATEMLAELLLRLAEKKRFEDDETEFLNHLWELLDRLDVQLQMVLIDNFKFIMESRLIKLCTNVLRVNNNVCSLPANVTRLFALCRNNPKLCCSVKSVLYTLFAYSGYNKALLKIIEMI